MAVRLQTRLWLKVQRHTFRKPNVLFVRSRKSTLNRQIISKILKLSTITTLPSSCVIFCPQKT